MNSLCYFLGRMVQLGHRARGAALVVRADGLEVLGEAVAEFGDGFGDPA